MKAAPPQRPPQSDEDRRFTALLGAIDSLGDDGEEQGRLLACLRWLVRLPPSHQLALLARYPEPLVLVFAVDDGDGDIRWEIDTFGDKAPK